MSDALPTTPDNDSSTDQPTDRDLATAPGIGLPRSFLVEGQGPVTVVRTFGDVTERTEGGLTISRRLETLEEFGEFWYMRNLTHWKRRAIRAVLEDHENEHLQYVIDDEQLEAWNIEVDGHVRAYFGVGELVEDGVDVEALDDSLSREFANRVAHARGDVGEIVAAFARDLKTSELWGPGAQIAEIAVRHGEREALEGHVDAFLEEVSDERR